MTKFLARDAVSVTWYSTSCSAPLSQAEGVRRQDAATPPLHLHIGGPRLASWEVRWQRCAFSECQTIYRRVPPLFACCSCFYCAIFCGADSGVCRFGSCIRSTQAEAQSCASIIRTLCQVVRLERWDSGSWDEKNWWDTIVPDSDLEVFMEIVRDKTVLRTRRDTWERQCWDTGLIMSSML